MKVLSVFLLFLFRVVAGAIDIVVVSENGYDVPRTVIPQALNYLKKTNTDIGMYRDVVVQDAMSEQDICKEIFGGASPPSLVIDTTLRPLQTESKVSARVKKIVRSMGIPTVSTTYGRGMNFPNWEKLTDTEKEYLANVPPPGEMISQIVRAITKLQSLPTVSVLYDETFVMDHKLSTLLQNLAVKSLVRVLPSGSEKEINNVTKQYKQTEMANFFVLASLATMGKLLSSAQSLNMFQLQYAWVLITKEDNFPSCPSCNGTVLFLKPEVTDKTRFELINDYRFPYSSKVDTAFYFDVAEMVVRAASEELKNGRWPTLTYPQCGASITEAQRGERKAIKLSTALQQLSFNGAFGKFVIRSNDNAYQENKMSLYKIDFSGGSQTKPETMGSVLCKTPIPDVTMLQEKEKVVKKLAARTIYRVVTVEQPPFVMKRPGVEGKAGYYGYCIDLIEDIRQIIGFDYIIYPSPDGLFGNMDDKTNWNGMMNELIQDRADIALGPISVMAERETVVDFTVPYYDLVGISILMKKPVVQASLFKFLTVLENNVWGCILGAYFFTSFLMYIFDRLSPYSFHNNREKYKDDDEKRDFNIKECMWFCMTSLTPQGGGEAPRNLSGRLVAATWWLFGFIIIASYTANLAAFLTVSRLDSPIESLDDLAKQYKVKYAPQNGSSSMTYFERMAHIEERFYEIWKNMSLDDTLNETERAKLAVWDYPVSDKYTKIWWTMKEGKDMPETFEEGVERVQKSIGNEGFAFIADSTQVKYATMTNCDLVQVGTEFSRKPLALAVQQGSPLKDQLSSAILKLLNQRKLESLKEKWWNKNPQKKECDDTSKQSEGISIQNIGGVFIVIFIGVVLAIITLAIEYWYYRQKRKSTRVVAVKEYGGQHNKDPIKR